MPRIPRDRSPDSSLALAVDGYRFISKRCFRYGTDIFQTRLLFKPAVCMMGESAAKAFYESGALSRKGAVPGVVQKTLFGRCGIQSLDGAAHRSRKQMFMSLMSPEAIRRLTEMVAEDWQRRIADWEALDRVVLMDAVREILFWAVCRWAGVPLDPAEVRHRADDMGALIEGPASIGPRQWRGRAARKRENRWIGRLIASVRNGTLAADEEKALFRVAMHREPDGDLLDTHTAAVELINILRPTVAIDRFITFAALALFSYPDCRRKLESDEPGYRECFVQEVRRFYPFFPFVGAIAKESFAFNGYHIPKGMLVFLDLYGTNHDERSWERPHMFFPERFQRWDQSPYNFIPQGGGDHYRNHRCPGEWITIEVMKTAVDLLLNSMAYEVPEQDLSIRLSRMPAIPKSRFVIRNVRRTGSAS